MPSRAAPRPLPGEFAKANVLVEVIGAGKRQTQAYHANTLKLALTPPLLAGRVDEEVEAVSDTLGRNFAVTGFYSNGEISPDHAGPECHLHNQTMTITTFSER